MVYFKYTSKYVCFMLHICDNLADFHTSCFLFKSFSSFPYLSRALKPVLLLYFPRCLQNKLFVTIILPCPLQLKVSIIYNNDKFIAMFGIIIWFSDQYFLAVRKQYF